MQDDSLSVTVNPWRPSESVEEPPRRPALWDGRPFPGKCDVGDCPNQATSAYAHYLHHARCDEHRRSA